MKGEIFIAPEVKRKESKEKASIFTLSVYTIPLLFVVVSSSSVIDRKKHEKKSIAKKAFCKNYSLSRALSSSFRAFSRVLSTTRRFCLVA